MGEKRFLTYDEQITFLEKEKGLIISNKEYAKKILLKIGYFPLINGYKEIFKEPINNQFQKGTSFEDIYELYDFDNDLRNIFIKYILLAERNIKSSLSYHFCKEYGDLQSDYLNVNNYDYTGKKKSIIDKMVKIMSGQLRYDSDYIYIRHYMTTYHYVPLWVLMNVLTIGQLSKIYASQKGRIQIPKEKGRYTYGKNDLYAQVIILKLLLSTEDFHKFFHDLKMCFKKHSIHKEILGKMGFPENWQRIGRIKNYIKSEIL